MASVTITPVLKNVCASLGEAPFWDENTKTLFFVSLLDGEIHLWNSDSGLHEVIKITENDEKSATFIIPCEKGGFLCGVDQKLVKVNWSEGNLSREVLFEIDQKYPDLTKFNDGKCDPTGRLVAGSITLDSTPGVMSKPGCGGIYGLNENGQVKLLASDLTLSNGLDWSADGKTLYIVDTVPRLIYAFDWDADTFTAANKRVVIDFNSFDDKSVGLPDGLTIDKNGNLWIACIFGSRIINCDPNTGKIISEIRMPVPHVTSCCFGGDNYDEMYVTTLNKLRETTSNELGGSVFKITGLGVNGYPSRKYKF